MKKNSVKWKDIVKVGDKFINEEAEVQFEADVIEKIGRTYLGDTADEIIQNLSEIIGPDRDCIYDCDSFLSAIREKYGKDFNGTLMFDDLDEAEESRFMEVKDQLIDVAELGGYINGINI